MNEFDDDWRMRGQEQYMKDVELVWTRYASPSRSSRPDHCEFCGGQFSESDTPAGITEGYATLDGFRWICRDCFDDFKDRFHWRVQGDRSG